MAKRPAGPVIRVRGARQHNLKNLDLDLPVGRLIVITGPSGSGKSSLAFDTLFAEGQRRYIETFSPYARQFFDRMDKPAVERIEGIPPAIAIEQRNAVKSTRSTVGTMTEICDHLKVLWARLAELHCRQCGQRVRKDSPRAVWEAVSGSPFGRGMECLVTFDVPLSDRLSLEESLNLVSRQGYRRVLVGTRVTRIEEAADDLRRLGMQHLTVVQDRLKIETSQRARFVEACEQAYHFGKGRLTILGVDGAGELGKAMPFSNRLHCATCDIEYREPTPALFSFNHPIGACPRCRGFGRIIGIDYALAIPDRSLSIRQGVVRPWRSGFSAECQEDLLRFCAARGVPTDVPFCDLPQEQQDWIVHGDPDYGTDEAHQWPHAWYGVKGYFRWLESRTYKMHVRVLLSRYRAYEPCPDCHGTRFRPESLWYRLARPNALNQEQPQSLNLAEFYQLTLAEAHEVVRGLARRHRLQPRNTLRLALEEVEARLGYLVRIGLGYLTLDRPTRTLSGGETERVNLTRCLGTRLVNTLFVLDEPSVGLHPRDTQRLIETLQELRDAGNTVVVVEHEAAVIRAADQVVDLGPGHGEKGGSLVFQGPLRELVRCKESLTGLYLSGRKHVSITGRRPVILANGVTPQSQQDASAGRPAELNPCLTIEHATRHNLRDLTVRIPLERLVCITGVSGSGKTTLTREVILPALARWLGTMEGGKATADDVEDVAEVPEATGVGGTAEDVLLSGGQRLTKVVLVDQSPVGKTPRSNPGVYTGAFDHIREIFARSESARQRGLNASAFSFNSGAGQCQRCRGAGFEKVEMQFLSDVFIRCPDCNGRRYRDQVLRVKVARWSIGDVLDATVDEVIRYLDDLPESMPVERARQGLLLLQEVGLGYLRLGQPVNTLSGGESQRLKLVRHLAMAREKPRSGTQEPLTGGATAHQVMFLFDEPTTGLHFDDVRLLVAVLQRLVSERHSVVVVEHNLDVIKCADWVIDLGPEAGEGGGRIVAEGPPEAVAACLTSHTGHALRQVLPHWRRKGNRS